MILTGIFLLLLVAIVVLFFIPSTNLFLLRCITLSTVSSIFLLSIILLFLFDINNHYFQFVANYSWGFQFLNIYFYVGLDGISIYFFFLSNFLIFLCIIFIWDETLLKEYFLNLLILDLLLLLVFSVLDLLLFYVFFEAILIPMYFIIGIWGSRERKIRAVYFFFFYTLVGSLCLLLSLLYIYSIVGTLDYEYLLMYKFSLTQQCWLWLGFFLSFASKIPMFPFHIWLPEAHVEAPTVGSVLLAGILLKLGVYGFLRFSLILFPDASFFFSPFVYLLSLLGIVYASLCAIRQTDFKRIIAYSSIAHMNLITIGIFSFNLNGIEGAILQSLSHGFVSGALFFIIGILYNRYHSRSIFYYNGLVHTMPLFSIFFLIFTLANIAFPGTSSFVGEFLILLGIFKINIFTCLFATLGVILCGAYSLWLYNRIIFGNLNIVNTIYFRDLNFKEFSILFPLFSLMLLMGIYPNFFLQYIQMSSLRLLILAIF